MLVLLEAACVKNAGPLGVQNSAGKWRLVCKVYVGRA